VKHWWKYAILPLAAITLFSVRVRAQEDASQPASGVIRGVVLESGTQQPISGAAVSVAAASAASLESSAKTTTDAAGAFAISMKMPGRYRVEASKPGYQPPSGPSAAAEVELEERYPDAEVKLLLGHFGALTGSVVDGAGKPLPDLRLQAVHENASAMRFLPFGPEVKTDAEGRFVVSSLAPGNYAIEILPQAPAPDRLLTAFTEADAEKVDQDYERTYWPGGHGAESALPVSAPAGATVDIGTLRIQKIPYYRVHVRIPVAPCDESDSMSVYETSGGPAGGSLNRVLLGQAPCGKDILVTGHPSGSFRLFLRVAGENGSSASVPFVIGDQNITITAPLLPDVTVDGAFVIAEGAQPPDFTKLSVMLLPTDGVMDVLPSQPADSDGKFQIPYVRPVAQTVTVLGLSAGHYVKEVRYNGSALSGSTVPLEQGAIAPALTIVLDDKPAAISGYVVAPEGRAVRPTVIAVTWPWDGTTPGPSGMAQGDASGSFLMTGLTPGEYRVIAIPSLSRDLPAVSEAAFERIMEGGAKVELSVGALVNVTLDLTPLPAPAQ
jgi:hypothetical protein